MNLYPNSQYEFSRRRFLSETAQGLGLAAAYPLLSKSALAHEHGGRKPLGIALVGLGGYATRQLAPALQETEYCKLTGIVTGTKEKEKVWSDKYGIKQENIYNYENYDSIAENEDIDIIYVVLPNSMHAEYTIRAAQAGKHVICEKPMAVSVAECQQMIDACQKAGVKLSIGYRLHFSPYHRRIIELSKGEELGAPRYVQSEFGFTIGNPNQWRLKKALAGGGAVMDVGVYCIQGSRYATGLEPVAISAQEFKTDPVKFGEVDETVTWQLEFPNGIVSNSTTSYSLRTNRLYVNYEKARAELEPAYSYRGLAGHINNEPLDFGRTNQQAKQMDGFVKTIWEDVESDVSGEEGLRDMRVVEALYQSIAQGGKRVEI